jgi:uncharacterized membrane protein
MQPKQSGLGALNTDSPLRPSDIHTAMVHLYRAEITRANSWRSRLDVTTNWALVSTGAAVSFAFGQQAIHHTVIILNTVLITLFLVIEARRYRYYELWSYRTRLMETDFYAAMLVPPFKPDPDWSGKLAESLLNPQFTVSNWEAIGRRLRRNYLWVYLVLLIAWVAKLLLYPTAMTSWGQVIDRAHMGSVPGELVMGLVVAFYLGLLVVAVTTLRLRNATGEVFPRYGASAQPQNKPVPNVDPQMSVAATPEKTHPFLAIVTADQIAPIASSLQAQFNRPMTQLDPNNTTGTQVTLLVPIAVTEIAALKALVKERDAQGVVIVIPAEDVFFQSAAIQKQGEQIPSP